MSAALKRIVEAKWFGNIILVLILLAGALVGLETSTTVMEQFGRPILILDAAIVYLFAIEALMKMGAHGKRFYRYFQDPWNVFDFIIVAACLLPLDGHHAAVLRLIRVFRALRLISALPRLQVLVNSLIKSLPSMGHVGMLLFILFYIYAVLGVFLWRDNDPVHFRDLGTSFLSLFRIITLEDWTDIMYIQMKGSAGYDFTAAEMELISKHATYESVAQPVVAVIYFVSFVLFGTMIMLNLVIGVIINSMNEATAEAQIIIRKRLGVHEPTQREQLEDLETKLREAGELIDALRRRERLKE